VTGEYKQRIKALRGNLESWQVDGLLVTNPVNCAWLSGFRGSSASLLITAGEAILATDSRYWEQAAEQAPDFELFKHNRTLAETAELLRAAAVSTAGTEANHISVQQAQELESIPGISWRHLDQPVEPLRLVKTAQEIDAIRAAAAITDKTIAQLPSLITTGISEKELAWRLERTMRDFGADAMAFTPIVAFGPNGALPHHAPGDRRLQTGDILLVDMGARLDGYNSDLTRTYLHGAEPGARFDDVYSAVLKAQETAVNGIRPGADSQQVHLLAERAIADAGFGGAFNHGLGHGLGLELHEDPFLSARRKPQELAEGMVITIEPGIYLPGWGGVRIEDVILVTRNGAEYLSHAPKLRVIGTA